MSKHVVVIGQGYVGLPVAMRAVEVGYRVTGIDLDRRKVERLNAADSYVEDVSDAELAAARASGRFVAVDHYDDDLDFDIAVISVPTPLRDSLPDLSFIEQAGAALASRIRSGTTVILESTTYPGTTADILVPLLEHGSGLTAGRDFFVGYSPERIDPGNPVWGFVETPKVVSGIDAESLAKVQAFYDDLVTTTVPVSGTREAELTKLLENTFRHVNIALINEMAIFAGELGVDVWEAIDAAASKPFGFMKFTPGPGVGGHCLPVDPSYLSWEVRRKLGRSFRFIDLANDVNDHMPDHVVTRVTAMLNDLSLPAKGARILLVGLAYKANTGDVREAPSLRVIELLSALGAELSAIDAHVADHHWPAGVAVVAPGCLDPAEFDLAVVLTDHDSFDVTALAGLSTFDTRRVVDGAHAVLL